jgi:hypothetical protein
MNNTINFETGLDPFFHFYKKDYIEESYYKKLEEHFPEEEGPFRIIAYFSSGNSDMLFAGETLEDCQNSIDELWESFKEIFGPSRPEDKYPKPFDEDEDYP